MDSADKFDAPSSEWPRGSEPAPPELIDRVRSKGRAVVIVQSGSEELRFLDYMKANANCGGERQDHILLRSDARKIEVIEEFLHGTQFRLGLARNLDPRDLEVHVKEFMIRHNRLLALSAEDVGILRQMVRRESM